MGGVALGGGAVAPLLPRIVPLTFGPERALNQSDQEKSSFCASAGCVPAVIARPGPGKLSTFPRSGSGSQEAIGNIPFAPPGIMFETFRPAPSATGQ